MTNYCWHLIFTYTAVDTVLPFWTVHLALFKSTQPSESWRLLLHLCLASAWQTAICLFFFCLNLHETGDFTSRLLVQKHGSHQCPVAFSVSKPPPEVQGMPACFEAVAATAILIEKSAPIVKAHVVYKLWFCMVFSIFWTQHVTAVHTSGCKVVQLCTGTTHVVRPDVPWDAPGHETVKPKKKEN